MGAPILEVGYDCLDFTLLENDRYWPELSSKILYALFEFGLSETSIPLPLIIPSCEWVFTIPNPAFKYSLDFFESNLKREYEEVSGLIWSFQ